MVSFQKVAPKSFTLSAFVSGLLASVKQAKNLWENRQHTSILVSTHGVKPRLVGIIAVVPAELTCFDNRTDKGNHIRRGCDIPVHQPEGVQLERLWIAAILGDNTLPDRLLVLSPLGQIKWLCCLGRGLELVHRDLEVLG